MRVRIGVLLISTVLAGNVGVPGTATADVADEHAPVELLYTLVADGGRVAARSGSDSYTLVLEDVPSTVTTFSDRPNRIAFREPIEDVVALWDDDGAFAEDPPNAALVVVDAPEARDTFIFELSDPRYDEDRATLRFDATAIETPSARLAALADAVDTRIPRRFGRSSLFVDPSPDQPVTLTISGVPGGSEGSISQTVGYFYLFETNVLSGEVTRISTGFNDPGFSTPAGGPTTSVQFRGFFCVPEGTTSTTIGLYGPVGSRAPAGLTATLEFGDGGTTQTLRPDVNQEVPVPVDYQLRGCS